MNDINELAVKCYLTLANDGLGKAVVWQLLSVNPYGIAVTAEVKLK